LEPEVLNQVMATAVDQAERTATDTITVMVRTGGPQVLILEPADGTWTNRARTDVSGVVVGGPTATADGTVTVATPGQAAQTVSLASDGTFRALDLPLSEGETAITATATDPQDRTGEATVTLSSDQTAPAVSLLADGQPLEEGATFNQTITVTVQVSDAGASEPGDLPAPQVRLNGSVQTASVPITEVAINSDGGYLLAVTAEDHAGNQTRVDRSFVLDLGGCSLTDIEPATGTAVVASAVTIRGRSGSAASVTIRVPVAGGDPEQPTYTDYPALLADGTFVAGDVPLPEVGENAIEITCSDAAGTTASEPLLIERLPEGAGPVVRIEAPVDGQALGDKTVVISGDVSDGDLSDGDATVTVNSARTTLSDTPDQDDGRYGWTTTLVLPEGPTILAARAVDEVGRVGKDRIIINSDSKSPQVRITSPTSSTWLGPAGESAPATITVSGLVDLDNEPHLHPLVTVATNQGTVDATVD
ncbi:MAG: hypothetical protein GY841_03385, partial [FCB group bacterium]|nr:hypothetical protein [FCB group bacterium]